MWIVSILFNIHWFYNESQAFFYLLYSLYSTYEYTMLNKIMNVYFGSQNTTIIKQLSYACWLKLFEFQALSAINYTG